MTIKFGELAFGKPKMQVDGGARSAGAFANPLSNGPAVTQYLGEERALLAPGGKKVGFSTTDKSGKQYKHS